MDRIYRNREGYRDVTAGKAIQNTEMPDEIRKKYKVMKHIARLKN